MKRYLFALSCAVFLIAAAPIVVNPGGGGGAFTGGTVQAVAQGPNGAVGAPTWSFSGDSNTGVYYSNATESRIAAGGTYAAAIGGDVNNSYMYTSLTAGTAAAPNFHGTSTTTGLYEPASAQLGFSQNGAIFASLRTSTLTDAALCFGAYASATAPCLVWNSTPTMYLREGDNGNWAGTFDMGSGTVKTGNGASATPAISFSADSDTGFFNNGGTIVTMSAGGTPTFPSFAYGYAFGNLSQSNTVYLRLASNAGGPTAGDCDADSERGRMIVDHTNHRLYVCGGATRGWDYKDLTD